MKKFVIPLLFSLSFTAFSQINDEVDKLYDAIEQNDSSAFTSLTTLAQNNDAYALAVLGFIYEHGVSVPRSIEQAIQYYQRACEIDGSYGCYNAGYFYQYGILLASFLHS